MGREVQNMIQILKFVPFQSSLVCSFSGLQGYQVFEDPPGIETFRTRCGLDASQENGEIWNQINQATVPHLIIISYYIPHVLL